MAVSARVGRAAAVAAVAGMLALAAFQVVLVLGAPLGEAAWGGTSAELSTGERIGSALSVVFYAAATWAVLGRAGLVTGRPRPAQLTRATWGLAVVLALSALMQFASSSRWENVVMGPLATVLAILCALVASSPCPPPRRLADRA